METGGPRTCLGQQMAYLEAKVLTFMVLRQYEVSLHDPNFVATYKPALTLMPKDGVKVLITRRNK